MEDKKLMMLVIGCTAFILIMCFAVIAVVLFFNSRQIKWAKEIEELKKRQGRA